jgi:hypothetical protein
MAWLSQLAYETRLPDKVTRTGRRWGLSHIRPFNQPARSTLPLSSTHGVLATRNDSVIISFAGTDPLNLLNWISNFYLGRPSADVHEGFQDAAATVWNEVGIAIESCIESNRSLFITGHSLGAAIAIITADRARKETRRIRNLHFRGASRGQIRVRECLQFQLWRHDLSISPWQGHRFDRTAIRVGLSSRRSSAAM